MTTYHVEPSESVNKYLYRVEVSAVDALNNFEGTKPLYLGSCTDRKSVDIRKPYSVLLGSRAM